MKLFKKLNEQMEVNACKSTVVNEQEKKEMENKILYEDFIEELSKDLEIVKD